MTRETKTYTQIVQSPKFQALMARKKAFLMPMCLFFFAFYFTLPLLTAYSKVLNAPAVGAISWAWVLAFAQFVMTWTLCGIYTRKAAEFDRLAKEVVDEAEGGQSA